MLLETFYRFIYNPFVNSILRKTGKFINQLIGTKLVFPVAGIINLKGYDGRSFVIEANETSFVAHTMYWNGVESYEYTTLFSKIAPRVNVFFDIGSNIGLYSILGGIYNPQMNIYAFDPTEASYIYTNRNLSHNKISNGRMFKCALANEKGKMIFHDVLKKKYAYQKYHLSGSSSLIGDFISGNEYSVETNTIDNFIIENNLDKVDVIKIDAERAEPLILEGGMKALAKFKPIIFCEIRPDMMTIIQNLTNQLGYKMYHVRPEKLVLINSADVLNYNWDHDFMFVHPNNSSIVKDFL